MSHAAQCMACKFAHWRGRTVDGCQAFEHAAIPATVAIALTSLIYRAAAAAPCAVRERVYIGPDAYLAQDLPTKE